MQTLARDRQLIFDCLKAWNKADAAQTAAFYAEELDYRDPNTPDGIRSRDGLRRYLRVLFRRWPEQNWTPRELLPHEAAGAYSATYDFRFANKRTAVSGWGMDRFEFRDGLIALNWVFLNAGSWPQVVGQIGRQ